MEYGISTVAYPQLLLGADLARIARLAPLAELRCDSEHCISDPRNLRAAQSAGAAGLRFTVHGPFMRQEIWSANKNSRRAAVAAHERFIELAARIGAEVYVVHPDYTVKRTSYNPLVVSSLHDSFAQLREMQSEFKLKIAIENMPGVGHSHFATPELDTCGLPICVDVGHANLSGCLPQMIARRDIVHWHLQDNNGRGDDPHNAVGRGTVDWPLVLKRVHETVIERNATIVLEVGSDADVLTSLAYLRAAEQLLPALPAA